MTDSNKDKEYEKIVTQSHDGDESQKNVCDIDDGKEDRKAAREFKFFALKTMTLTLAGVVLSVISSFIYAYAKHEKDMDKGILDTIFSTIVEVIKILL